MCDCHEQIYSVMYYNVCTCSYIRSYIIMYIVCMRSLKFPLLLLHTYIYLLAVVQLSCSTRLMQNYSVVYIISGGSHGDYKSGPFNVTILPGNNSASYNISITDDNIFETNETFNLTINASSLLSRVVLQPNCMIVCTIIDNHDGELHVIALHAMYISMQLATMKVNRENFHSFKHIFMLL